MAVSREGVCQRPPWTAAVSIDPRRSHDRAVHIAFALAAFIALAVALARAIKRHNRRAHFFALPGHTKENPLPTDSYKLAQHYARHAPCFCGQEMFYGGEMTTAQNLYVVTMECDRCEQLRRFYFDTAEAPQ